MPDIMITCPRTVLAVPTGLSTDAVVFDTLPNVQFRRTADRAERSTIGEQSRLGCKMVPRASGAKATRALLRLIEPHFHVGRSRCFKVAVPEGSFWRSRVPRFSYAFQRSRYGGPAIFRWGARQSG